MKIQKVINKHMSKGLEFKLEMQRLNEDEVKREERRLQVIAMKSAANSQEDAEDDRTVKLLKKHRKQLKKKAANSAAYTTADKALTKARNSKSKKLAARVK